MSDPCLWLGLRENCMTGESGHAHCARAAPWPAVSHAVRPTGEQPAWRGAVRIQERFCTMWTRLAASLPAECASHFFKSELFKHLVLLQATQHPTSCIHRFFFSWGDEEYPYSVFPEITFKQFMYLFVLDSSGVRDLAEIMRLMYHSFFFFFSSYCLRSTARWGSCLYFKENKVPGQYAYFHETFRRHSTTAVLGCLFRLKPTRMFALKQVASLSLESSCVLIKCIF